jgi:predicted nicotinamide N-methyase
MSFSFNFIQEPDSNNNNKDEHDDAEDTVEAAMDVQQETSTTSIIGSSNISISAFEWLQRDDVKERYDAIFKDYSTLERASESIRLLPKDNNNGTTTTTTTTTTIRRIREELSLLKSTTSMEYQNTDLVPGKYEGGLKVWECSTDLCRYLAEHKTTIKGHILELGCGHGLPACWVLKQGITNRNECYVTFSDYNEFVLNDVTIRNVALNVQESWLELSSSIESQHDSIITWLDNHVAFGAGDWNDMSRMLLTQQQVEEQKQPKAVPNDGMFDFVFAAETTYSETAAFETARFVAKHLKPNTGIAYIATKRYYFGVGGGTDSFCNALMNQPDGHHFDIQTLQVYDDGASNIRELLMIKRQ